MITVANEEAAGSAEQEREAAPKLSNAQMFQENWESKGERVIADLLRTAVEFPQSEMAEHMQRELAARKDLGLRSTDVEDAMKTFVEKQVKQSNDPTWREIARSLWEHSSGAKSNATISHAVQKFLSGFTIARGD